MKHEFVKEPLDSDIASMQQRWKDSGIPDLFEGADPSASRERGRNVRSIFYPWPKLPKGRIERLTIPGPAGEIPVRIVWPHDGEAKGTLVYLHGGGWIVGDLDSHELHAVRIANRSGVAVLNVDYRLAPEHLFPAAIEDAFAAVQWAAAHLSRLGGEGEPLAVGGDSAPASSSRRSCCFMASAISAASATISPAPDIWGRTTGTYARTRGRRRSSPTSLASRMRSSPSACTTFSIRIISS